MPGIGGGESACPCFNTADLAGFAYDLATCPQSLPALPFPPNTREWIALKSGDLFTAAGVANAGVSSLDQSCYYSDSALNTQVVVWGLPKSQYDACFVIVRSRQQELGLCP